MKTTFILAMACAIGATAASAQTPHGAQPNASGDSRHPPMATHPMAAMHEAPRPIDQPAEMMGPDHHMNGGGWNNGRIHDNMHGNPPTHWTHGRMAWSGHARRCAARYRTYNPRTDMFMMRVGMARRCRL